MSGFPRVAVGSWGERPDPGPICWALAACLERRGQRVRHFLARACYGAPQGAVTATGTASQYLDCRLSSTDFCRTLLAETYISADFVLVEGRYPRVDPETCESEHELASLAHRLDLPRILVLDAAAAADCRLPPRPDAVDGVILDGVTGCDQFVRMQTCVEGAWGVPVVGAMERDEGLRQQLVCLRPGRTVSPEIINALVERMSGYLQYDAFQAIAGRPTLPQPSAPCCLLPQLNGRPTVALAFDDAFCGYFADVLEKLEQLGARVVDFSPLADEALPDGTDVVLIGCGRPDEYADRLSANHCMRSALREFARRGGFVYSEGGGTAYLSRALMLTDGRTVPMVDALPLAAHVMNEPEPWQPVDFTLAKPSRLGRPGTRLRGYRGGRYRYIPQSPCTTPAVELPDDLFAHGGAVGGRMQLHFIAQSPLLCSLFEPPDAAPELYATVG